ncbi:uncharacterized protein LOC127258049 [Andrographis paniculata]|uniref:uncharacterized protein LOC127258049 n=1 Tax=Andrographis paniculata TaxID=175694 RepID=UPI0021E6F032|nr:uncharacterized protein LOC127258049 [Andrographis paniculata]
MAEEECICQHIIFDDEEPGIDNNSYTTTEESGFTITFKFLIKPVIEEWLVSEDSFPPRTYLGQDRDWEISVAYAKIKKDQLFNRKDASKIVGDQLNHWHLCEYHRLMVVNFTLVKAYRAIRSLSKDSKWNAVEIECPMTVTYTRLNEDGDGMVPAEESSIEMSLRRVANSTETCTVCLEEMTGQCKAVAMPCEHVFHEDCVKKWLRRSHYCPSCRYELPTNDD